MLGMGHTAGPGGAASLSSVSLLPFSRLRERGRTYRWLLRLIVKDRDRKMVKL